MIRKNAIQDFRIIQWNSFAVLTNSDVSRFIGAIPIVGYLILYNDGVAEFMSFSNIAGQSEGERSRFFLDGLVKLRLTFFGSFLVLIAMAVFRWFRPLCLTIAKDEMSFASIVSENYSSHEIIKMDQEVNSDGWIIRTPLVDQRDRDLLQPTSAHSPVLNKHTDRRTITQMHLNYVRLLAREWWAGQMHADKTARIIIFVVSLSGFAMLMLPSLDIFQAVTGEIIETLFHPK